MPTPKEPRFPSWRCFEQRRAHQDEALDVARHEPVRIDRKAWPSSAGETRQIARVVRLGQEERGFLVRLSGYLQQDIHVDASRARLERTGQAHGDAQRG